MTWALAFWTLLWRKKGREYTEARIKARDHIREEIKKLFRE